jgi:hypothetical protein
LRSVAHSCESECTLKGSKLNLHGSTHPQYIMTDRDTHSVAASIGMCTVKVTASHAHLIVPLKSTGSWGITDTLDRSAFNPILATSTPSISICPCSSSVSLSNARNRELKETEC